MLTKGCTGYLPNVVDTTKKVKIQLSDVHVVCKFLYVFPKYLPGLPPDREIKFEIELLPEMELIPKVSYRMAPTELRVLLDKKIIPCSYSP